VGEVDFQPLEALLEERDVPEEKKALTWIGEKEADSADRGTGFCRKGGF